MKQADANFGVPIAAQEPARSVRRTYSLQFKREVVAQCLAPGASVSAVAMSHRINANVVRKWLPRHREQPEAAPVTLLPVNITRSSVAVRPRPRVDAPTAPRAPIELILGEAIVRLPAGFDSAELHSIVQILAALR
jgi:transposase-like protein